jgi:hypothetical protein
MKHSDVHPNLGKMKRRKRRVILGINQNAVKTVLLLLLLLLLPLSRLLFSEPASNRSRHGFC